MNLGFNDPVLTNLQQNPTWGYWEALASDMLLGWTIEAAQGPLPNGGFVSINGASDPFALIESGGSDALARFGKYSLYVSTYWDSLHLPRGWIRLSQTGMVPIDAAQLRYFEWRSGVLSPPPPIDVYVNGILQTPLVPPGGNALLDVSQFAGQEVSLSFLFPGGGAGYEFDIVGFAPVPEPSVWALLAFGVLTLIVVGRKRES